MTSDRHHPIELIGPYQKVRDLFTTAVDYDKGSDAAQLFFQKVQNKMLWAVTGQTAAEIIAARRPTLRHRTWA